VSLSRRFVPETEGTVLNRATLLTDKGPPVYLGDALGDDVIRERGELLLQLVEQLHDSDVRAVALPHRGPPSSWQGLPAGAGISSLHIMSSVLAIEPIQGGR